MHASYDWYIAKWIFYFLFIHLILSSLKACKTDRIEILEELLTRNANIEEKDKYECTPLIIGIYSKMDYFLFKHFCLFLLKATEERQIEIVKELLSRNANIEAKNRYGCTPLMIGILLNGFFIFYSSI